MIWGAIVGAAAALVVIVAHDIWRGHRESRVAIRRLERKTQLVKWNTRDREGE